MNDGIESGHISPQDAELRFPNQHQVNTEARSVLASGSLLSQTAETRLLPEERFSSKLDGEVREIRKIGDTVAILTKNGDHYEASFFDNKGNLLKSHLDPTSHDLATNSKAKYTGYLRLQQYT